MTNKPMTRRVALTALGAVLATPALVRAQPIVVDHQPLEDGPTPDELRTFSEAGQVTRHNVSSFEIQNWRDHFDTLGSGAIVADTRSRALHYWSPTGTYLLFPSSVPRSEDLTRRGYATIVRKTEFPTWTPTASMRKRDPDLPTQIAGGDPNNPLGTRAMYLSWPAYLIHGTHDTRKIGRMSSSGCIGLYNNHVEQLYPMVSVGTQVRVL